MKGHIQKKGDRYFVVVEIGDARAQRCTGCGRRSWIDGVPLTSCAKCGRELEETRERRRMGLGGFRRKKDAEERLREAVTKDDEQSLRVRPSVSVFLPAWLDRHDVRPRTRKRYRDFVELWWLPRLPDLPIDKIKPTHVQSVLDAMRDAGRAPRTIRQARAVLSKAFNDALDRELVDRNPVARAKIPKIGRAEVVVLLDEHVVAVLDAAEVTGWRIPILLAAMTGARRSEVLGAQWSDIDLDSARMTIRRSLQRNPDSAELEFLPAKSDDSHRTITLTTTAVEALRAHRVAQNERRLAAGSAWRDLGLVCERGDGGPLDPDAFTKATKRIMRVAGIPPKARLHDLRHAIAVLLALDGVPLEAATAILGHSSPAFTLSTYRHVVESMTRQATDAIERRLGRTSAESKTAGASD